MKTLAATISATLAFSFIFQLSCPWLPPAQAAQPLNGRYIQIVLPGAQRILSLAEVEVYSGNSNVALNGKASQISSFSDAFAARAIDGSTVGNYSDHSVAHTTSESHAWWELDLGAEHAITKIVIYNRTDCCLDRINPANILLLNNAKQIIWEEIIASESAKYEFDTTVPTTATLNISRNLLRNSTFQQRTNPFIPDYWDLHHAAARRFRNLHDQYGVDDSILSPVKDARVLKIINSDDTFDHLILMPHKFFSKLPEGDYTFSLYIKSDTNGMEYRVTPAWAQGKSIARKLSVKWERHMATFHLSGSNPDTIQPILYFPNKGAYYITAPQLERGTTPSPFQPSRDDSRAEDASITLRQQATNLLSSLSSAAAYNNGMLFSAGFEYSYYTESAFARLTLSSKYDFDLIPQIECRNETNKSLVLPIQSKIIVHKLSSLTFDIPIKNFPVGDYICTVEAFNGPIKQVVARATLRKLPTHLIEVRINNDKRFITVNDKPFHVIGIAAGGGDPLPDWYFSDIAAHGVNTVFYTRSPNTHGEYDLRDIQAFILGAARYDLRVIVGTPLSGAKVADWRQRLNGFTKLITSLKDNPTVIGWFPVDEPAARTWQDNELMEVYNTIKNTDPYRLVFVNWAYDGVPLGVGQEPRGTLGSTDIYSSDYYPFAGQGRSMDGFTETAVRALATARIHKKIAHSWIQIYGGNDAWREPTGDEINYMVYVNLIYGGMISYWDTKSNSKATWERLSKINQEAKMLAEELFLNPESRETLSPVAKGNFLYSVWQKRSRAFLVVAHTNNGTEEFAIDPSRLTSRSILHARSLFEKKDVSMANGQIQEWFHPFESKVYLLDNE